MMRSLRARGHSILLVEQNHALATAIADDIHVIASGRFVFAGTPAQLAREPAILDRHLGVAATPAT